MTPPESAVLLLSGGMDSATLLWSMRVQGIRSIHTVSIDYGQRHRVELQSSQVLSVAGGAVTHKVIELDLTQIGGSPLTSDRLKVPVATDDKQINTVVPYRNTLFVTLAAAYAETLGISDIYISPVREDFAAYRDCRREFYDALERALSLGATRETKIAIHTPFVHLLKSEVIGQGLRLGVAYDMTHTCYEGIRPACGRCDACAERIEAFKANGTTDPIPYAIAIDWPSQTRPATST